MSKNLDVVTPKVEIVANGDRLIAHVYDLSQAHPVFFPTPEDAEMQCGFGQVSRVTEIPAHIHNPIERNIASTSEFVLVLEGSMKVTFIDEKEQSIKSFQLGELECFLQFSGGHQIEFAEGTRYIELKQGPYLGNSKDKTVITNFVN